MTILFKVPLNSKDVSNYLEEEKSFLKGVIEKLYEINPENLKAKIVESINQLIEVLPNEVDKIYPAKSSKIQVQALLNIAKTLTKAFAKTKFNDLEIKSRWVELTDGYLGRFVEEDYEIAILLYIITAIYQTKALANVQTSSEYRYFYISALSAIKGAIAFMERLAPEQEHYAYQFYQMLLMRKLEIEAEVTKSEAFIARKQGDFERASKLFAGAASYRFGMMNFELPEESDIRVKIYASTELGMACFYIAVGLTNLNESEQAHFYLLKSKNYFENAAKLSENNTELLEAANKRLDLVNPYIDRIEGTYEKSKTKIEEVPDPQPIMLHPEPEALLSPNDKDFDNIERICSNCNERIPWEDKCSKCGENIIPLE
ncbi:MAG: hypothetical protein FK734_16870 [Asgard group archaeon]|nr:hypothetical protein [Asgard group archaeon]